MLAAARNGVFQVMVAEDSERIWCNRAESGPRSAEWEDLGMPLLTAVGDDTRLTGWRVMQIKQVIGDEARKRRVADLRQLSWQAHCYGLFHTPLAIWLRLHHGHASYDGRMPAMRRNIPWPCPTYGHRAHPPAWWTGIGAYPVEVRHNPYRPAACRRYRMACRRPPGEDQ
jgi:hypothetical protein